MSHSSIFGKFSGCREAVLRVQAVRQRRGVRAGDLRQHAALPLHLVRGLEMRRVLPGRQVQLLRNGESTGGSCKEFATACSILIIFRVCLKS